MQLDEKYNTLRDKVINTTSEKDIKEALTTYLDFYFHVIGLTGSNATNETTADVFRCYDNKWMIHYRTGDYSDPGYLDPKQFLLSKKHEIVDKYKLLIYENESDEESMEESMDENDD